MISTIVFGAARPWSWPRRSRFTQGFMTPQYLSNLLTGVLAVPAAGVCLFTLAGFLGRFNWLFDLASHFRLQYLLILLPGSLVFWILGRLSYAALFFMPLFLAFALLNLAEIFPLYIPPDRSQGASRRMRLLVANVLQRNSAYGLVRRLVEDVRPDLIVLVETNQVWIDALQSLQQEYPYHYHAIREDNYGLSFYSRFPIQQAETCSFCDADVPTIVARLEVDGQELTVIGTHPPPPRGQKGSVYRNQQLAALARYVNSINGPLLLCGDFNISPWSPYFRQLLRDSGLLDSERGFGLHPTWPVDRPLLRVPIDHCLISPQIQVTSRRVGPYTGSDHFPVIIDFLL